MYETYYGFTEKPFNLTPDPKYLYLSSRHTEAFAHLSFGHQERGGFVVLSGEVGTGKTTLARYFLSGLGPDTATAVVLYPALTAAELLRSILDDLHVEARGASLKDLVDALHRFLLEARENGRSVVLMIDEAQDLSPDVLEQIRLLSNLETDTEKLIQIVLLGQPELLEMLARHDLRQLAQRVTARYHIGPLNRAETEAYVQHRIQVAGGLGKVLFTKGALVAAHAVSGGVPRVLNLVCDRALLAGYAHGTRTITPATVRIAAREIQGGARRLNGRGAAAAALAVASVLLAAGAIASFRSTPAVATPAPTLEPAPAAAASPAPASAARLPGLVLRAPRDAAVQSSLERLRSLWGAEPLERITLRANRDMLRRLDLPALLEMFHPERADTVPLALVGLQGDQAVVSILGETASVSWSEVDALWTRQATFLWRDAERLLQDPARAEIWQQARLLELRYARPGDSNALALEGFQRDLGLVPDGVLGARTLMALVTRGPAPRPRLLGATS